MKSLPLFSKILFPDQYGCVFCNRELKTPNPHGTCGRCMVKLPFIQNPCLGCGKEMIGEGRFCIRCKENRKSFDTAYACFTYLGDCKMIVHRLKYGNKRYLAKFLSVFMVDRYMATPQNAEVITWVSMHPSKLKKRGYDQAELLAKETALRLGLPCEQLVECVKLHKNFAQLGADERREEARSAFTCTSQVKGKRILVIDDVLTTGSTMDAVAHVLKKAGAKEVVGLTLCSTPINSREDFKPLLPEEKV